MSQQIKQRTLLFLLSLLVGLGTLSQAKVANKVIAVVNGEAIWLAGFEKVATPIIDQYKKASLTVELPQERIKDIRSKVLDQMIDDKLLLQEAKNEKIRVNKRDIEDGIVEVKRRFERDPSTGIRLSRTKQEKAFREELKKEGITEEEFTERIKEQLMVIKLIDREVKAKTSVPTDKELRGLFEDVKRRVKNPKDPKEANSQQEQERRAMAQLMKAQISKQVRARHILLRTDKNMSFKEKSAIRRTLENLRQRLAKGEDFEALAKKHSEDPESAKRGGDLGYIPKGLMVPAFEKAAFALDVGEFSEIIETEFGYHLIFVDEKKAARKLKYDDVKEYLANYLFQQKAAKRFKGWIAKLRKSAQIKINPIN